MGNVSLGAVACLFAIICAKWALELGFRQTRQLLWGLGGLFFGPLVALTLYVLLIRQNVAQARPGGKW